jgi:hypothetical protein
MKLGPDTKIKELIDTHPYLRDFLMDYAPHFRALDNPILWRTVGRFATLSRAAVMGGVELPPLLAALAGEIQRRTGQGPEVEGEAKAASSRQEALKEIIRDLHATENVSAAKERFRELIKDVAPWEIGQMEQSLIQEGLPESEVKRLCSVHVDVFRESLETKTVPGLPDGHPVHTLMRENREAERLANALVAPGLADRPGEAAPLVRSLSQVEIHYRRKENQLFPVLEEKGFAGPSKVMWAVHDDIRALLKTARSQADGGTIEATLREKLAGEVRDMVYKEEHILYPAALELLSEEDWGRVAAGEGEIGYAWDLAPEKVWHPSGAAAPAEFLARAAGSIALETGTLTASQLNLILTHLPLDISFVDEEDRVVYYSASPERIFPRSPGVIGRKVQNCHPPKSVATVERILAEFKAGTRSRADFWIRLQGRFILIRYFAIRSAGGSYQGCLEVSQDVTDIRALEGERRLLDWE